MCSSRGVSADEHNLIFLKKGSISMKYKVLINGRNQLLVTDFIQHTENFFDTLSTSELWQDITGHLKYFKPEVYVLFVEPEYEKTVGQLNNLKAEGFIEDTVIVLIGDSVTCDQLEQKARFAADIIIRRPVTPDNLALRITRYFDDINEAKERVKARQLERQQRAEAELAAKEERAAQREAFIEAKAAEFMAKEPEVPVPAASSAPASSEKKHILIVDDDRTILKLLKSALGDTYDVTTMINGVMVDKCIETKNVDLMILDYEMPIETGADIFRRVKKNPKAAHIPVCFLTGVSEREKIMEVMSLKPHGYLLKPIDMDMLTATVKNLTD